MYRVSPLWFASLCTRVPCPRTLSPTAIGRGTHDGRPRRRIGKDLQLSGRSKWQASVDLPPGPG